MRRGVVTTPVSAPGGISLAAWTAMGMAQRFEYLARKQQGKPIEDDTTVYSFRPVGAWPRGLVGPSGFVTGRIAAGALVTAYARRYGAVVAELDGDRYQLATDDRLGTLEVYAVR